MLIEWTYGNIYQYANPEFAVYNWSNTILAFSSLKRTYYIPPDNRETKIPVDNRTVYVPKDTRESVV